MTQEMMSREEIRSFIKGSYGRPESMEALLQLGNTALAYYDQKEINKELYEAGEQLLMFLSMGPLDFAATYGPDFDPNDMLKDVADRMQSAIAKARGETND